MSCHFELIRIKMYKIDKDKSWSAFCVVTILIALVPIVLATCRNMLECDEAYYLTFVERISAGSDLYADVNCGYTPLFFYILAGLKYMLHIGYGRYEFYLAVFFIFQICCSYFIYKICREFKINRYLSYIVAWAFLIQSHYMEGNVVLLEIPSMTFGLAGTYMSINNKYNSWHKYVLVGFLYSCAMLCKQYGAGYIAIGVILIMIFEHDKIRKILYMSIGFVLPILLCILYWKTDFIMLFFSGYGTSSAKAAGYDVSLAQKINMILHAYKNLCFRVAWVFPVSLLFVPLIIKNGYIKHYLFCLFGAVVFSFQFYFTYSVHYMLFFLPYIAIISAVIISVSTSIVSKIVSYSSFGLMILFALYSTYHNRVYKLYLKDYKQKQVEFASKVKSYVDDDKTLWIVHGGMYYVYYMADIKPPLMEYSFGPLAIDENRATQLAESADYVLSYVKDYPYDSFYTQRLKDYVWAHEMIVMDDESVLHIMK